jgi:hypothetical protein
VLFPVTFFFFDEISVVSPLTNIVILPLSSIAIILGMIFAATGGVSFLAVPLLFAGGIISRITVFTAEFFGGSELSYIPTGYNFELPLLFALSVGSVIVIFIINKPEMLPRTLLASFGVMILSVWIYRCIPDDNLYVAVLGDENSAAVVVRDKFSASVTDFSGGDVSIAVKKYLNSVGITDVSMILLNKNSARALSVYIQDLSLMNKSLIYLPQKQHFYNQKDVYAYEYSVNEFAYDNYTITPLNEDFMSFMFFERVMMNVTDDKMSAVNNLLPQIEVYLSKTEITPLSPEYIVASDSSARVFAKSDTDVFIGESTEFTVCPDGKIYSRILV